MNILDIKKIDKNVQLITLQNGPVNVIDPQLISELKVALSNQEVSGTIITGQKDIFSAGLDFKELSNSPQELGAFLGSFLELTLMMSAYDKPLVFAISGHCAAGGTVLALTADYRILQEGAYQIGLNELEVGLPVPAVISDLMAFVIGYNKAYQSIMFSTRYSPDKALETNLVDELSPNVVDSAIQKIYKILQLEQTAWRLTKQNLKAELNKKLQSNVLEQSATILAFSQTQAFKESLKKTLKK